jgi:hypothetical protein
MRQIFKAQPFGTVPRGKSSKHSILALCHETNPQSMTFWHGAMRQIFKAQHFGTVPRGKSSKHSILA